MALVVLCGHPASGKSGLAGALADALRAAGREVMVVGEESAALDRNVAYQGAPWAKEGGQDGVFFPFLFSRHRGPRPQLLASQTRWRRSRLAGRSSRRWSTR